MRRKPCHLEDNDVDAAYTQIYKTINHPSALRTCTRQTVFGLRLTFNNMLSLALFIQKHVYHWEQESMQMESR